MVNEVTKIVQEGNSQFRRILLFVSMIKKLEITGFRSFPKFKIGKLARVNLFVGKNNTGKTSLLEAIEILALGTPEGLYQSPRRRLEFLFQDQSGSHRPFTHLFTGHDLRPGSSFKIKAPNLGSVECRIIEAELNEQIQLFDDPDLPPQLDRLKIEFKSRKVRPPVSFSVSSDIRRVYRADNLDKPVNFVGTEDIVSRDLSRQWDQVVLTPEEELVTSALQIIEPRIQRIAFLAEGRNTRPGVFLKLNDTHVRLPLGSVGDGLKRILSLAIHLATSAGGWLLVDEIDTGLHHTVIADLWRLVIRTAERLDTQVCATTHSLDCVRALASVVVADGLAATDVLLHRVENGLDETVIYTPKELAIAADQRLEVR